MAHKPLRSPRALVGATLLLAAVVLLAVYSGMASGVAAKELGKTSTTPNPACPKSCSVFGSVTGFQVSADGNKPAFKVPSNGHIVGWKVDLSKPNKEQRGLLEDDFGKPTARIQILKGQGRGRFKLTKQSPKVRLDKSLGKEPIFTLNKPLRVKKGTVVALSTSSWASNFALSQSNDKWRASRKTGKCDSDADLRKSKPQRKIGSTKKYGCTYDAGRVLYWAYFVPSKTGK